MLHKRQKGPSCELLLHTTTYVLYYLLFLGKGKPFGHDGFACRRVALILVRSGAIAIAIVRHALGAALLPVRLRFEA